jgi:hypothetical protein
MTNQFQMTGVIKFIGDTAQVSEKFKKREFVVTELSDKDSKYDQHIAFQLTQDKCDLINAFGVGQTVKVSFNLRGREWVSPQGETKYFNTLEAWRVEADVISAPQDLGTYVLTSVPSEPAASAPADDEDLPF